MSFFLKHFLVKIVRHYRSKIKRLFINSRTRGRQFDMASNALQKDYRYQEHVKNKKRHPCNSGINVGNFACAKNIYFQLYTGWLIKKLFIYNAP